jgi:hypothetical protein
MILENTEERQINRERERKERQRERQKREREREKEREREERLGMDGISNCQSFIIKCVSFHLANRLSLLLSILSLPKRKKVGFCVEGLRLLHLPNTKGFGREKSGF